MPLIKHIGKGKATEKVYLTTEEVAELLSKDWPTVITTNNVRQIKQRGSITVQFKKKGLVYFDKEEVERYAVNRRGYRTRTLQRRDTNLRSARQFG